MHSRRAEALWEPPVSDKDIDAAVAAQAARGARFIKTEEGAWRRLDSISSLYARGLLSDYGLRGAHLYGGDYHRIFYQASLRSTIYARIGERESDEDTLEAAHMATRALQSVTAACFGGDLRLRQMADELCGKSVSDAHMERAAIKAGLPVAMENVARWYQAHDDRAHLPHDAAAMRLVSKEDWRLLALAFNPSMSEDAFDRAYAESEMEAAHKLAAERFASGLNYGHRLREKALRQEAFAAAKALWSERPDSASEFMENRAFAAAAPQLRSELIARGEMTVGLASATSGYGGTWMPNMGRGKRSGRSSAEQVNRKERREVEKIAMAMAIERRRAGKVVA